LFTVFSEEFFPVGKVPQNMKDSDGCHGDAELNMPGEQRSKPAEKNTIVQLYNQKKTKQACDQKRNKQSRIPYFTVD